MGHHLKTISNKSLLHFHYKQVRFFNLTNAMQFVLHNSSTSQNLKDKEIEKCKAEKVTACIPDPCSIDPQCVQPKVVIVGAGMAGLSAAHRLIQCGIKNLTIVEALDRPGGRIHTCWMCDKAAELGALWIEGSCIANPVFNLACQEGLLTPPLIKANTSPGIFFTSSGQVLPSSMVYQAYKKFSDIRRQAQALFVKTKKAEGSLMKFMKDKISREVKTYPENQQNNISSIMYSLMNDIRCKWGQDLSNISAEQFGSFTEIPGGLTYLPLGFNGILSPLLQVISESKIKYNKPVECVKWGPTGTTVPRALVKTHDGEEIPADYVIITISLGVLKSQVETLFCPPLPARKLDAIKKVGFGHINKVFLEYNKPFWVCNEGFLKPIWSEEELLHRSEWVKSIGIIEEVPGCPKILMCSVGGIEALCLETLPETVIVQEITQLIRRCTGDPTLPFPKTVLRSMWSSDPYFEGATSYMSLESKYDHQVALGNPLPELGYPRAPILLFAGEATIPGYYGTVQGARLSGIREADRISELTRSFGGPPICEEPQCHLPH